MTTAHFISSKSYRIEYFLFEGGDHYLISFHGFGEHAVSLKSLLPHVKNKYSVLAINLIHHGESKLTNQESKVNQNMLKEMIALLQKKHHFENYSVFGYSLGAKVALQLLQLYPKSINEMILFAPDGIVNNQWYNLAVKYAWSRSIFKSIVRNPSWFFSLTNLLTNIRIVPPSLNKFVKIHLRDQQQRELVYQVWVAYQQIVPDVKTIRKIVIENKVEMSLYFGKRDRIIPATIGEKFTKNMPSHVKLYLLEAGHELMTAKHLKNIR